MMRVYFEGIGMLGPVYRMVGHGFSDREIASKLNVDEVKVTSCIAWTLHFLHLTEREQLVADAGGPFPAGTRTHTPPEAGCN
jgi:hypothetical protein